jgi:hypothetical protein
MALMAPAGGFSAEQMQAALDMALNANNANSANSASNA